MKKINKKIKRKIKLHFESKYGRNLTDDEVVEIAENLAGYMETIYKFIWRKKYENTIQ